MHVLFLQGIPEADDIKSVLDYGVDFNPLPRSKSSYMALGQLVWTLVMSAQKGIESLPQTQLFQTINFVRSKT